MKKSILISTLPLLPILLFIIILLIPEVSSAAQPLVPCDGVNTQCSFCHFVSLGNRILGWLFGLVFILFGVIAFVAGFGLVTSGGNQSKLDDAKKKLSNAFVGLIIVFAAWLIVDTLMKALVTDGNLSGVSGGLGMWNEISCGIGAQSEPIANQIIGCNDNGNGTETCVTHADSPLPGQACSPLGLPYEYNFECTYTRDTAVADDDSGSGPSVPDGNPDDPGGA